MENNLSQDMQKEVAVSDEETEKEVQPGRNKVPPSHEIPDGGWLAWLQVLGAWLMLFNSWGIINTFGVYQTFYAENLLSTSSASDISWIGSLQSSLLMIISALIGPLFDRGYFRPIILTGSFLMVFGMMMTSLCTSYWQLVLAHGVAVGLGCGCLFLPSVAVLSTYFNKKKALAIGIATSGSSIAGVIYPIVFHRLQPQIGFPWATRVLGFMILGTMILPNVVMKVRVLPKQKRALFDAGALRDAPFVLFIIGSFFGFMGLYIPFYYIPEYSVFVHAMTPSFSLYTIAIINASSTFGRIIPNYIADKTGPLNLMSPFTFIAGILAFCWISAESKESIILICVFYGFFSGTIVSLPPTITASLSPNLGTIGTRLGMLFAVSGIGLLIGNPIAGAILGSGQNYIGLQSFCGASVLISALFFYLARISHVGFGFFKVA